jgi:hypothetical protein
MSIESIEREIATTKANNAAMRELISDMEAALARQTGGQSSQPESRPARRSFEDREEELLWRARSYQKRHGCSLFEALEALDG